jgi:hypothetical protein
LVTNVPVPAGATPGSGKVGAVPVPAVAANGRPPGPMSRNVPFALPVFSDAEPAFVPPSLLRTLGQPLKPA